MIRVHHCCLQNILLLILTAHYHQGLPWHLDALSECTTAACEHFFGFAFHFHSSVVTKVAEVLSVCATAALNNLFFILTAH